MTHAYQFTLEGVGMNPHYESCDVYFVNSFLESVDKIFLPYNLISYHLQREKKSCIVSDILVEHFAKPLKWLDKIEIKLGFRNTKGLRIYTNFEAFTTKKK